MDVGVSVSSFTLRYMNEELTFCEDAQTRGSLNIIALRNNWKDEHDIFVYYLYDAGLDSDVIKDRLHGLFLNILEVVGVVFGSLTPEVVGRRVGAIGGEYDG